MGILLTTLVSLVASAADLTQPAHVRAEPSHVAPSEQRSDQALDLSVAASERSLPGSRIEDPPPVFNRTDERWAQSAEQPGVWLCQMRAQLGGIPGDRRFHFASFRLTQSPVFGANVAASVDKHAARIVLNWPTSN